MAGWQEGRKPRSERGRVTRWPHALVLVVGASAVITASAAWSLRAAAQTTPAAPTFAALVEQLSEPNGEFDTDNLISNESSYLHVVPALEQGGVTGGVYIGVGPDQNFSYIARIRPTSAFIIDIRRDNLLLHLLLKAIFAASRNRMEFLSVLTGRPAPDRLDTWRDASIDEIVGYLDETKPAAAAAVDGRLHDTMRTFGVQVSAKELATIDRFHASFVQAGLSLQFHSSGRPALEYYPTYRDLLLETDRRGRKLCYLASEDDFQFVRALEARDGVVPVVGDLSGPHTLRAIGQLIARRGDRVSAFYVSNIENYLFRDGSFTRYMDNVKQLPRSDKSVIIRSIFRGYSLPDSVPGYYSTSTVQNMNELVTKCGVGRCRGYVDLLHR